MAAVGGLMWGGGCNEDDSSDALGSVGEDEFEDHYDPQGDAQDLEELSRLRAEALGISIAAVAEIKTDAILSCPGCFQTVCSFGSQRHVHYRHQYRAPLADNVKVHSEERLRDPRASRDADGFTTEGGAESDEYYRVSCDACGTDVGVQDVHDGLYHFYHVLPSEA